ncbi:MAG: transporter substrate-binding domain-containing protein [Desulfobacteraceae bacterium]|jgi:polar amino acid transport system substrate-binding protein/glutamate/aspartate transport system substrate-binding protein|nr:transporter substrate-binding domain-containing protein [Desulfobacteraceae bacterium]MDD3991841.1 transporter substrate-binding domain-containing protein [Desulfobacteraceae bacterium]
MRRQQVRRQSVFSLLAASLAVVVGLALAGPACAEGVLEKIEKTGKVNMGLREGSVPFGYINTKSEWVGFGIDIGQEIVDALSAKFGKKIEMVKHPINPKTRIPMVANGTVDIGIGSTTITLAREDVVDFSLPYFLTGTLLLVPKDSPIADFPDLAGKRVGMGSGSTANIKGLDKAMETGLIRPACEKVLFEEHNKGFLALQQGKIHAYFTDASILAGMKTKAEKPDDWKIVGQYLTYEPYGIILPEGQGEWRDFVNATLIRTIKSGRFEQTYNKWFGPEGEVPLPMSPEYKTLLQALSYPD